MKRLVRFASLAAAVAAIVAAIRALTREQDPLPAPATTPSAPWPPLRPETPPAAEPVNDATPTPDAAPAPNPPAGGTDAAWVDPAADGTCPDGYPIKAKMSSKIFHAPGQLNYDRTTPDRCYASAEAAEADGLRAAKR